MMNCDQIKTLLDGLLDGDLETDDKADVDAHLEGCDNCRQIVAEAEALKSRLARFGAMSVPQPAPDFYTRALARATHSGVRVQRNRWVMTGFGGAAAAALMIWVVSGMFFQSPSPELPSTPSVTMALETPQTFNLVFSSDMALKNASMTVALPDGIEIDGFSGQREISWMTSLKKGRNVLPLTLIATSPMGGELLATLQHEDDDKMFRLQVSVI